MRTILIADDSTFMRRFLKRKIQQHGHLDIVEATDGQKAIEAYKQIRPDIVFLDITMPNVNGLTALKEIIAFDLKAKVVMCSAMGTESNVIEALQLGAIDFIVKPNFESLVNVLDKLDSNTE
ncbi:response regulator [Lentibacillus cibarius]|uniref:Response regulator n=1 Tax=Lentibacillus cibarius TaxID=2583219 RepID=A0A5S3QJ10_9BACI|nr:response regulator [Lentibacillus cibarius]TMN21845.1 response regulator [Lentibacillus cibarius]